MLCEQDRRDSHAKASGSGRAPHGLQPTLKSSVQRPAGASNRLVHQSSALRELRKLRKEYQLAAPAATESASQVSVSSTPLVRRLGKTPVGSLLPAGPYAVSTAVIRYRSAKRFSTDVMQLSSLMGLADHHSRADKRGTGGDKSLAA